MMVAVSILGHPRRTIISFVQKRLLLLELGCLLYKVERLARDSGEQMQSFNLKVRELEEQVQNLSKEKDQLVKHRGSAIQEAHLWRSELAKARERAVILEGAVVRAEEKVRVSEGDAESRIKEAMEKEAKAANEKQELLAYITILQEQLKSRLRHEKSLQRRPSPAQVRAPIYH